MPKRESCASILLAPRPPSRSPPTYDPHSTRCTAGCHTPATSCIGAFRPPAVGGVRGETIIPAAENLHTSGHSKTTHYALAEHARFAQERQFIGGPAANPAANFERRPVSGDPAPSEADIQMTKAIIGNATPLGRAVHDHIIVGKNGYANLKGPRLI